MTKYVYDRDDILLELDGANSITTRYTRGIGLDQPLITERGGQSFFYHSDTLGSITEITDTGGNVVKSYKYSSFGKIESETNPSLNQPYTFTAREFDQETGLLYYRSRYYDPTIGRFTQEDKIGFAGGINFFVYTWNNPVKFIDPFGEAPAPSAGNPSKCLIACLIQVESSGNPDAVSPKGATGLMQVFPIVVKDLQRLNIIPKDVTIDLKNPGQNVTIGSLYISYLLGRYNNNVDLALAAYNAGPTAVDRAGRNIPNIDETQNYVEKIKKCLGDKSATGCC